MGTAATAADPSGQYPYYNAKLESLTHRMPNLSFEGLGQQQQHLSVGLQQQQQQQQPLTSILQQQQQQLSGRVDATTEVLLLQQQQQLQPPQKQQPSPSASAVTS